MPSPSLGQLLLVGVPGPVLDPETASAFRRIQAGGYILFARNIQTPAQLRQLIDDLRGLSDVEPIITIDQEGGRVSRLKLLGNEPPNANQLRDKGDLAHRTARAYHARLCASSGSISIFARCSTSPSTMRRIIRCAAAATGMTWRRSIRNASAFNDGVARGRDPELRQTFSRLLARAARCAPRVARHRSSPGPSSRRMNSRSSAHFAARGGFDDDRPRLLSATRGEQNAVVAFSKNRHGPAPRRAGLRGSNHDGRPRYGGDPESLQPQGNHPARDHRRQRSRDDLPSHHEIEEALGYLREVPKAELDRAMENVARFKTRWLTPDAWDETEFLRRDAEVWDLRVATLGPEMARHRSPEDGKRSPVETY